MNFTELWEIVVLYYGFIYITFICSLYTKRFIPVTWLELLYFTTFRRAMNPSIFISTVYETCQICYVLARMFRILRHIEQACQLVKCTFKNVTLILPCWIFEIKTIISVSDPTLCCDNVPCINIISQMHYHSRIQHNCFMPSLAFFSTFFIGFLW